MDTLVIGGSDVHKLVWANFASGGFGPFVHLCCERYETSELVLFNRWVCDPIAEQVENRATKEAEIITLSAARPHRADDDQLN